MLSLQDYFTKSQVKTNPVKMFWKNGVTRVTFLARQTQDGDMVTIRAHRVFALTVIVLSLATGNLQYFGSPINCWTPIQFSRAMADFAESSCYFKPTYYTAIAPDHPTPIKPFVNYYKLTPFVLAFIGVLYLGPEMITKLGSKLVRFNFKSLQETAHQSLKGSNESRKAAIEQLVNDLQHRLTDRAKVIRGKRTNFRRWLGNISPSLPFFIHLRNLSKKLVFVMVAIVPLILLRHYLFFNLDSHYQIITENSIVSNRTLFPKEIYCAFEVRRLGNIHQYIVQCALPANDMFEKITLFVCFLAIVVGIVTLCDVISSAALPLFTPWDYPYIKRHMEGFTCTGVTSGYDKEQLRNFVERYLNADVIFLLQLIGQNSSEHVVCQVLARLWKGYVERSFGDTALEPTSKEEKPFWKLRI